MYQILTKRAIIVNLDVHSWSGEMVDRKVGVDVATRARARAAPEKVGRYIKNLAREALAPIRKAGGEIRKEHYKFTMPWIGDSRVLPVALYGRYVRVVNGLIRKYDSAREEFISAYPRHIRTAKGELGDLFDEDDFLSPDELRERITAEYGFSPMPLVEHLVEFELTRTVNVRIRKNVERQIERRVESTIHHLDERLGKPIRACSDRLAPGPDGRPKTFHNTLVTNLRESAELVIELNITEDVYLSRVATHITGLLKGVSAGQLRKGKRGFNRRVYEEVKASVDEYSSLDFKRERRRLARAGGLSAAMFGKKRRR